MSLEKYTYDMTWLKKIFYITVNGEAIHDFRHAISEHNDFIAFGIAHYYDDILLK